jgi:hypothetical protein
MNWRKVVRSGFGLFSLAAYIFGRRKLKESVPVVGEVVEEITRPSDSEAHSEGDNDEWSE